LPGGASLVSTPTGCTLTAGVLSCAVGMLASGASSTVTINVKWTITGPVYDSASVASVGAEERRPVEIHQIGGK